MGHVLQFLDDLRPEGCGNRFRQNRAGQDLEDRLHLLEQLLQRVVIREVQLLDSVHKPRRQLRAFLGMVGQRVFPPGRVTLFEALQSLFLDGDVAHHLACVAASGPGREILKEMCNAHHAFSLLSCSQLRRISTVSSCFSPISSRS